MKNVFYKLHKLPRGVKLSALITGGIQSCNMNIQQTERNNKFGTSQKD